MRYINGGFSVNNTEVEIKVSVIVPICNEEKYIKECIRSIVSQDLKEIEIIIIDDGSTDSSRSIVKEFIDSINNITLICSPNMGAGYARNKGIETAKGEYVIFMDGDDYYPNKQVLSLLYDSAKKVNAKVCGGSFSILYADKLIKVFGGRESGYTFEVAGWVESSKYQFDYGYHRFLYERSFLIEHDLTFPEYKRYQDPPFLAKVLCEVDSFWGIPEVCYCLRDSCKKHNWKREMCIDLLKGVNACLDISIHKQWAYMHYLNTIRVGTDFYEIIHNFKDDKDVQNQLMHIKEKINWEWVTCYTDECEQAHCSWLKQHAILQNIIFPDMECCDCEEMYYHRNYLVHLVPQGSYLSFYNTGKVHVDGYMNLFSAGKWNKYCDVHQAALNIDVKGKFEIIFYKTEERAKGLETEKIHSRIFHNNVRGMTTIPFNIEEAETQMYKFEIRALGDDVAFYGGYYSSIRMLRNNKVNLAVIICTFQREEFIKKNVGMFRKNFLENESSDLHGNIELFVVDNGRTLSGEAFENKYIQLIYNKNVGGSGGFTRGMIEAYKVKQERNITNVLLMDDDITIVPETIERTYRILQYVKPQWADSFIGGAMISMDEKWRQVEAGANWENGFLKSYKNGLDLRISEHCYINEIEENYGYNAWWYCCMPVSVIREDNLPLPLFIREDDIEYGLRNMNNLILLNGICVWHLPFEKKYSSMLYYYTMRNRLLGCTTLGLDYSYKDFKRDFWGFFKYEIFCFRYKNAEMLLQAIQDYMKGIQWFAEQDGEILNKQITDKGYRLQDIGELNCEFEYNTYLQTVNMLESKTQQLKRMLSLNGMLSHSEGFGIIPTVNPHIAYVYGKHKILNYDIGSQKGFLTYKNKNEFWRLMRLYVKTLWQMKLRYNTIKKQYCIERNSIRNFSFWNRYLNL